MKIYLFEYIEELTDSYHSNGGAVVVAETQERAVQILEENGAKITEEELTAVTEMGESNKDREEFYIFPNAGCC